MKISKRQSLNGPGRGMIYQWFSWEIVRKNCIFLKKKKRPKLRIGYKKVFNLNSSFSGKPNCLFDENFFSVSKKRVLKPKI